MFNVSKKTLSVVLCLALLLSVVAVCFMTPATAKTVTSAQSYNTYGNIPSNIKFMEYTFDGSYGVPFARATNTISYEDGCMTAKNSGGWWFFGNEAAKSISKVEANNANDASLDTFVANNLLQVEEGKTYRVVFKYKIPKGAKIDTSRAITLGLAANPNQKVDSSNADAFTFSENNLKYEWTIDGVAQANGTNLSADTDWQTASAVITPKATAILGAQNYFGDGANYTNNKVVYDSITIYEYTSETFEKLTFDNGGLGVHRYLTGSSIAKEENGNGYCIINDSGATTGSAYFSNNPYTSKYSVGSSGDYKDATKLKKINQAYNNMFNFKSTQTYEVTFKYRYASTTSANADTPMILRLMADPAGVALNQDELTGSNASISWAKDIVYTGLYSPNELGLNKWHELKVVFTVKTAAENSTIIRADANQPSDSDVYNLTIEDTGAYFGIKCIGQIVHIDDFDIKLVEKRDSVSVTTDYVYHDMENDKVNTSTNATANGTIVANGNAGTTIKDADEADKAKYGKVLNLGSDASRFTVTDSGIFTKGKKYYISFDAKSTNGTSGFGWISLGKDKNSWGNISGGSQQDPRVGIHSTANVYNALKWYVNGAEVKYGDFVVTANQWNHFGIVIDLTDAAVVRAFEKARSDIFAANRWFYIGRPNSQFDNFTIVSTHGVEGAVPETDGADITTPSTIYFNDMSNVTASNITNNTADTTSVGTDESDPTRGNVIKFSSSATRSTINNTNVITCGSKYTISFEAKLDTTDATATKNIWMGITEYNSQSSGRYIINDNGTGCTNKDLLGAFKFYVQDLETGVKTEKTSTTLKVDNTWKRYIIEFDFTDAKFLAAIAKVNAAGDSIAQMYKLDEKISYFYFGCADGWFDNLKIVKYEPGSDVEVSIRKPSGTGENYLSAGLRFKAAVNNEVVKNAAEIGFVVAPSTNAARTTDWYKLENGLNPIARKGLAKVGASDDGWYYAKDDHYTYYQMVITGLSTEGGLTAYNRRFSAVLYVKNADGSYDYYALGETSYYQALGITEALKAQ